MWCTSRFTPFRIVAVSILMLAAIATTSVPPSSASVSGLLAGARPAVAAAMLSGKEYAITYAEDCVTPKTVFNLGDTVCVQAGDFPLPVSNYRYRRLSWIAPGLTIADEINIKEDPQYDRFMIPTSGQFALVGTWYVSTVSTDSDRFASAKFIVRNPRAAAIDLSVFKSGPPSVAATERAIYTLEISNPGPDTAYEITLVDEVPTNMTFTAIKQASGPLFECQTPARGETGRIVCTTKSLNVDDTAKLVVYYDVISDVREGEVCSSTAQITSYTEELSKENNYSTAQSKVIVRTSGGEEDTLPTEP